ncbi:MAG: M14 family metallopeptidase, partial [Candidatus Aminicenantes bacterium]|nr:M14 family metallopeptidase [Candidatus Aminicenantes bacterium]
MMKIKSAFLKAAALILLAGLITWSGAAAADDIRLSFDHFYDQAELTQALKSLEKAYPRLVTLQSIGKSVQGRDLWAVILNNPKTGPAEHKPGYYVDGNIHGNEIQGSEVALYMVWYLLKNFGKTDLATRLLDERAFYVVPTMNPDSREYYIHPPSDPNSPRTGWVPFDDDRDGAVDEDGPEDLDGDGSITMMRKKDPYGSYKLHPEDHRVLIPVKPGEKGEYELLGQEGIDND